MNDSHAEEKSVTEEEQMLKAIRSWVRLWRTNEVSSTEAMAAISLQFDNASKAYV